MDSGDTEPLAPGVMRMRFSPVDSSTMTTAVPVLVSWIWVMDVMSTLLALRESRRYLPKKSEPTAPVILMVMLELGLDDEDEFGGACC